VFSIKKATFEEDLGKWSYYTELLDKMFGLKLILGPCPSITTCHKVTTSCVSLAWQITCASTALAHRPACSRNFQHVYERPLMLTEFSLEEQRQLAPFYFNFIYKNEAVFKYSIFKLLLSLTF
jgi:hypothetical protein